MNVDLVLLALVLLGAVERLDSRDLHDSARSIAEACDTPPDYSFEMALDPLDCARAATVLWSLETNATFSLRPRTTFGCGVLQVNTVRSRALTTPTCRQLRDDPRLGFLWGVRMFRMKLYRAKGDLSLAFRYYNASHLQRFYERRAMVLWKRLKKDLGLVHPGGEARSDTQFDYGGIAGRPDDAEHAGHLEGLHLDGLATVEGVGRRTVDAVEELGIRVPEEPFHLDRRSAWSRQHGSDEDRVPLLRLE